MEEDIGEAFPHENELDLDLLKQVEQQSLQIRHLAAQLKETLTMGKGLRLCHTQYTPRVLSTIVGPVERYKEENKLLKSERERLLEYAQENTILKVRLQTQNSQTESSADAEEQENRPLSPAVTISPVYTECFNPYTQGRILIRSCCSGLRREEARLPNVNIPGEARIHQVSNLRSRHVEPQRLTYIGRDTRRSQLCFHPPEVTPTGENADPRRGAAVSILAAGHPAGEQVWIYV